MDEPGGPPPSYEEAAESLRRAKRSARRLSVASARTGATSIALPTNEREPLLASNDVRRHTRFTIANYFSPVWHKKYWKAVLHLVLLNFPFALLVWIILFLGVLVGSTLLLTLPLGTSIFSLVSYQATKNTELMCAGALVWWITLIASRFFANVEVRSHYETRRVQCILISCPSFCLEAVNASTVSWYLQP